MDAVKAVDAMKAVDAKKALNAKKAGRWNESFRNNDRHGSSRLCSTVLEEKNPNISLSAKPCCGS